MSLADSLRGAAHSGISVLGGDHALKVQLRTATQNVLSGHTTIDSTGHAITAARFRYRAEDVDGTNVLTGDQRFYLSGVDLVSAGVVPSKDDQLEENGRVWSIVALEANQPDLDDDPLYYRAQCRQRGAST